MKEWQEVIAFMDYSFERAFTMQEKECMLAYKVSNFDYISNKYQSFSCTFPKYKPTLTLSKLMQMTKQNKKKRKKRK